jgi:hypothetical protein
MIAEASTIRDERVRVRSQHKRRNQEANIDVPLVPSGDYRYIPRASEGNRMGLKHSDVLGRARDTSARPATMAQSDGSLLWTGDALLPYGIQTGTGDRIDSRRADLLQRAAVVGPGEGSGDLKPSE